MFTILLRCSNCVYFEPRWNCLPLHSTWKRSGIRYIQDWMGDKKCENKSDVVHLFDGWHTWDKSHLSFDIHDGTVDSSRVESICQGYRIDAIACNVSRIGKYFMSFLCHFGPVFYVNSAIIYSHLCNKNAEKTEREREREEKRERERENIGRKAWCDSWKMRNPGWREDKRDKQATTTKTLKIKILSLSI